MSRLVKKPGQITGVGFNNNCLTLITSVVDAKSGNPVNGQMCIELSPASSRAIKVHITNHKKSRHQIPYFANFKSNQNCTIEENEDFIIFKLGAMEAYISKGEVFGIEYRYKSELLTSSSLANGGSVCYDRGSRRLVTNESLSLEADEMLYGFGDNGAGITVNGMTKYTAASGSNKVNIPFYMSSRKYGVFVNTDAPVDFFFGTKIHSHVTFATNEEELEYIIMADDDLAGVLNSFAKITGQPNIIPSWTLGTSIKLSDDFTITDNDIINFVDSLADKGLPIRELWLGNSWLPANDISANNFDSTRFPDAAAFIRKLHERNIRVGITVNPFILQYGMYFNETMEANYLLNTAKDEIYCEDTTWGSTYILDMTHLGARNWMQQHVDLIAKCGVDFFESGFDYDFLVKGAGQEDFKFAGTDNSKEAINVFARYFNEILYAASANNRGSANAIVMTTDATCSDQTRAFVNVSTKNTSFGQLASSLRSSLNLAMSGFDFVNIDIPVFNYQSQDPSVLNTFLRWVEACSFTTHYRIECGIKTNSIEMLSADAFEKMKLFARIRSSLVPQIYAACGESVTTGLPSMRTLALEYNADFTSRHIDRQYMLGSNLMIAPVTCGNDTVQYFVPAGRWTNLLTREVVQGPTFKKSKMNIDAIPVLVRPNSIIATAAETGNQMSAISSAPETMNNLTFTCFELANGTPAVLEVFSNDGTHTGVISVLRENNKITVQTDGFTGTKRIALNGITSVVSVSESIPEMADWGTTIEFNSKNLVIQLQ